MNWTEFLELMADKYGLLNDIREVFLFIFSDENKDKNNIEISSILRMSQKTLERKLKEIYQVFSKDCFELNSGKKGKFKTLRSWLQKEYAQNKNSNFSEEKNTINWRKILNPENLNDYLKLRQNATEQDFELDIYVPLGLVERKEQQRRPLYQDLEVNQIYQLPEKEAITRKFEHQEFLDNIGLGNKPADDNKNIAIIGEPGAGKTTLLEKLAYTIYSENKGLPICISLANLEAKQTIKDYLENKWLETILTHNDLLPDFEVTENEIREFKKQFSQQKYRKVWLLLDGLDEMKATSPLESLKNIKQYINESYLSQARVIISCRVNVWDASITNPLSDFTTYRNLDFTDNQRNNFIREWFKRKDTNELGNSLIEKLQETGRERICELVKNPLRLVLLCRIWTLNQGELPETTAQFYQRYFPYFYNWKKEIIDLTDDYKKQDELHKALGRLAKQGIESQSRYRIKKRDAYKLMGKELFKLANDLGWLNIVDRDQATDEAVYAFYHPTFQEYFAACAVGNWDFFLPKEHINKPVEGKKYRIFEAKWKEVILLWIGRNDIEKTEKENFITALDGFKDGCEDFYFYRAYFLAALVIDQFKDCSLADNIVEQIVMWNVQGFSSINNAARETLPQTDRNRAIATLIDLIRTADHEWTCRTLAESLGKIGQGNEKAITALIELINTSTDRGILWRVAESLGKIGQGNKKVILALMELINTSTTNKWNRIIAAECLGKIDPGNEKAITALMELINTSTSEDIRMIAAEFLGKIDPGNEKAITALMKLINTSTTKEGSRIKAASILGEIDPGNEKAITALMELINTSTTNEWDRIIAAECLGKINPGNEKAITALMELINTSTTDEWTRGIAAEFLGKIDPGNEKAITGLLDLINTSTREWTRRIAAEFLGKIDPGNEKAITVLIDLIPTSDNAMISREAADSLEKIIQDEQMGKVVKELKEYLSDEMLENHRDRFESCYQVMWKCAQTLTYAEFYQAWHS